MSAGICIYPAICGTNKQPERAPPGSPDISAVFGHALTETKAVSAERNSAAAAMGAGPRRVRFFASRTLTPLEKWRRIGALFARVRVYLGEWVHVNEYIGSALTEGYGRDACWCERDGGGTPLILKLACRNAGRLPLASPL